MESVVIDSEFLVSIVATMFAVIGILILAVAHLYVSQIKKELADLKDLVQETKTITYHAHDRITDHVEDFHARAAT